MTGTLKLTEHVVYDRVADAAAAGTSTLTSDTIDTADVDGVAFVASLGDVTENAVLELVIQEGEESDGSDAADLTDTSVTFTAGASDADNKLLVAEIARPLKRYVRAKLVRGTANAAVDGIVALVYGQARTPVTQGTDVLGSVLALSPANS